MLDSTPEKTTAIINEKRLTGVEKDVQYMRESLVRIESNHLVHINDQLVSFNQALNTNQTSLTKLLTEELSKVYSKISELTISDAKIEPNNQMVTKIIEYVILAVVAGGIAFIISHN